MSDKSLRELGEEYESAAAIIKERIAAKRKQLRELQMKA